MKIKLFFSVLEPKQKDPETEKPVKPEIAVCPVPEPVPTIEPEPEKVIEIEPEKLAPEPKQLIAPEPEQAVVIEPQVVEPEPVVETEPEPVKPAESEETEKSEKPKIAFSSPLLHPIPKFNNVQSCYKWLQAQLSEISHGPLPKPISPVHRVILMRLKARRIFMETSQKQEFHQEEGWSVVPTIGTGTQSQGTVGTGTKICGTDQEDKINIQCLDYSKGVCKNECKN